MLTSVALGCGVMDAFFASYLWANYEYQGRK